jgi:ribosomal protein S18 acetylase RimI-like enzyme
MSGSFNFTEPRALTSKDPVADFDCDVEILNRYLQKHAFQAQLAVDKRFKGQGVGTELLRNAMLRTLNAAEIAGLRAIVVDAKDDNAKAFYQRYGFEPFKSEPMKLWLIHKDARAQLGKR